MFLSASKIQPTPFKKGVYLVAATILGVLLSLIVHTIIETAYLQWAQDNGKAVHWYTIFGGLTCSLHPVIQIGLLVLGAAGGYAIGRIWWRYVYVDKTWAKGKFNKEQNKINN